MTSRGGSYRDPHPPHISHRPQHFALDFHHLASNPSTPTTLGFHFFNTSFSTVPLLRKEDCVIHSLFFSRSLRAFESSSSLGLVCRSPVIRGVWQKCPPQTISRPFWPVFGRGHRRPMLQAMTRLTLGISLRTILACSRRILSSSPMRVRASRTPSPMATTILPFRRRSIVRPL